MENPMSETSPTDQGGTDAGASNEALPENQNQQPSADGQQPDSVSSGDSQDADQNNQNQPGADQTTDDGSSSSDDDGLAKFAKSQGIDDVSELSDREKQLLKTAHDNQKAFRTTKQEESDELKKTVEDVNSLDDEELEDLDEYDAREAKRDSEIAELRAAQRANDFWSNHQDDRKFEGKMAEIIVREAKANGKDAARYLAKDLSRVLILAKAESGGSPTADREQGAREERERLRQRQEAGADSGQAQQTQNSSKKVTRSDISQMSDEDYKKFRESGELDAAIARGDLY